MEFCPTCATRLVPRKKKGENRILLSCPKCGYEKPVKTPIPALRPTERTLQEHVVVIGKEEQKLKTMPIFTVECPKCGNNQAYVWQVQTRGADESTTQFFRCTKCAYTFREYS